MEVYKCLQVANQGKWASASVIRLKTAGNAFTGRGLAGWDVPAVTGNSGENY